MKNLILSIAILFISLVSYSQTLKITTTGLVSTYTKTTNIKLTEYMPGQNQHYYDSVFNTLSIIPINSTFLTTINWSGTNDYITIRDINFNNFNPQKVLNEIHDTLNINDGIYILQVEAIYGDSYMIKIDVSQTASVTNIVKEDINLNVFPNPVQDVATVTYASSTNTPVELYTLSGQLLHKETNTSVGSNEIKLEMSDYSNGTYLLKVGDSTMKLIVE